MLGSLAILVATAGVAASLMALAGLTIRNLDEANYDKRYGAAVEAKLPEKCFYSKSSTGKISHDITCHGATWKIPQGGSRTGMLKLAWQDSGETASVPDSVRAYTSGGTAYSTHMADFGAEYVFLGRFPLWLLLGLPLVLLGYAGVVLTNWQERPTREVVA